MTPAARIAAAAEVLDEIGTMGRAEPALKAWSRGNRYAGSKDRAAIRDHVFDVLRARRSLAKLGGGNTGRALMLGLLRRQGANIDAFFSGDGYGPAVLEAHEQATLAETPEMTDAEQADLPDWLWPIWADSLGATAMTTAQALQDRAPISLRVNLRRATIDNAQDILRQDAVKTCKVDKVNTALQVLENERRIKMSTAFMDGLVELQDVASQMAIQGFDLGKNSRVLDYCAGGGGKALAFADQYDAHIVAHDIAPQRMADLPDRAARAGVVVAHCATDALSAQTPFDLVFCDAPCSGSGTWRRTPDAKWQLTNQLLSEYNRMQDDALSAASRYVSDNGTLVYATCSVLRSENQDRIDAFLAAHEGWIVSETWQLAPNEIHDGFFRTVLHRGPVS